MTDTNKFFIAIIAIILSLVFPTRTVVKSIQFNQNCTGFLKQTADANSIELASERLQKALSYIEEHNLTNGYTSVLWQTEDENIEFWYKNLITCKAELDDAKDATQMEKTNVLMKIRESLTDTDADGTTITIPYGISRYPNNAAFAIINIFSLIILAVGVRFLLE